MTDISPTRVMLIEDNAEYREVIELALEDHPEIELTQCYGTAETALRSLYTTSAAAPPQLILLDLNLPGMSGLEALPLFRRELPATRIMILTQSDSETDVLRAISRGASGYLLKSASLQQITDGIRDVMDGGASLDKGVAQFILHTLQQKLPKKDLKNLLSDRELEVLTLISEGLVKKEIADQLKIGYTTVDTHVGHIYEKLGVRNAPAAVAKAFKLGLIEDLDG